MTCDANKPPQSDLGVWYRVTSPDPPPACGDCGRPLAIHMVEYPVGWICPECHPETPSGAERDAEVERLRGLPAALRDAEQRAAAARSWMEEARAESRRLRSDLAAAKSEILRLAETTPLRPGALDWRPIETAPMERGPMMICVGDGTVMGATRSMGEDIYLDRGGCILHGDWLDGDGDVRCPTHWAPMPDGPDKGEGEEGAQ